MQRQIKFSTNEDMIKISVDKRVLVMSVYEWRMLVRKSFAQLDDKDIESIVDFGNQYLLDRGLR